jgi:hypothetical protein
MKFPWFKRIGMFYIPKTLIGWLILITGLVYAVYKFLEIDKKSHSASDTLMNFFFYLLIIGAVYTLIAYLTSRNSEK